MLENDARRLLAYHIISQVGYMVCGVGLGSELALNGATAHAFSHILYKAVLFMGAGAVLEVTGRRKLTEMGGLYKTMPITLGLYMVGAFAISAVPLFSGFVSKSMVIAAAGEAHRAPIFLVLTLASAGTFLHTGLKLPYYMFFGEDRGLRAHEPPRNMLVAMGVGAAACVLIGVYPGLLYSRASISCGFAPYSVRTSSRRWGCWDSRRSALLRAQAPGIPSRQSASTPTGSIAAARRNPGVCMPGRSRGWMASSRRFMSSSCSGGVRRRRRLRRLDESVIDDTAVGVRRPPPTP